MNMISHQRNEANESMVKWHQTVSHQRMTRLKKKLKEIFTTTDDDDDDDTSISIRLNKNKNTSCQSQFCVNFYNKNRNLISIMTFGYSTLLLVTFDNEWWDWFNLLSIFFSQ